MNFPHENHQSILSYIQDIIALWVFLIFLIQPDPPSHKSLLHLVQLTTSLSSCDERRGANGKQIASYWLKIITRPIFAAIKKTISRIFLIQCMYVWHDNKSVCVIYKTVINFCQSPSMKCLLKLIKPGRDIHNTTFSSLHMIL